MPRKSPKEAGRLEEEQQFLQGCLECGRERAQLLQLALRSCLFVFLTLSCPLVFVRLVTPHSVCVLELEDPARMDLGQGNAPLYVL